MHSFQDWFPAIANLALQVAVLAVMVRKRFRVSFPFFFNFIVFCAVSLALRVALFSHISDRAYFCLYWTCAAIGTILLFAVLYEVFLHILRPYPALADLGKLLFRWSAVFVALVSIVTALATNGSEASKICATITLLVRTCELMQCGFLLLFLLFESRLSLSWRSPVVCIMTGFGTNAAILLTMSFLGDHAPGLCNALGLVAKFTGVAVYAVWYGSFALPQPQRRTVQDSPTRLILQRWNEALLASPLVGRNNQIAAMSPVESFLPGVERTVERVMARKMMH